MPGYRVCWMEHPEVAPAAPRTSLQLESSDSEGNFETPEAETPTRSPLKEFCEPPPGPPEPEAGTPEPSGHGDRPGNLTPKTRP
ncbi:hypothetical protein AV530_004575 [Patagioenas fasciata monilis]|uniref:Uncharacterized protein n=1 Tax=Patagioenas fasciata monilis TaxID=372326 RepID=A0A1V4KHE0_PATFA|nr:hypothetical protein AV530_004575 [Patagioenas fasciata monilis]